MPQLAPVNWLLLFFLFWFVVGLSSVVIWWSSKNLYSIEGQNTESSEGFVNGGVSNENLKSWRW
uniref:ATP synthase subunit 8 n=1 Tax=Phasianella australis TaxID=335753 RepID=A0A1D8MGH3_9VEST|nr:ATP synthase subunit 8 [Phasianella australis]